MKETVGVMLKKFLWVLPFFFFLMGYLGISLLVITDERETPALIGLSLPDAFNVMGELGLQGQVIAEQEDADRVPGSIVDQAPQAGKKIKRSQPIYLTITRRRAVPAAPSFVNLERDAIAERAADASIRVKYHELEMQFPRGRCCAQFPAAGYELTDRVVDVYLSAGGTTMRLFPKLVGLPVATVLEFLKMHGIQVQLFTDNALIDAALVADHAVTAQKPLAGTIIDLKKPLLVQLQVA